MQRHIPLKSEPDPASLQSSFLHRFIAFNWKWLLWSTLILFLVSIPSDKLPVAPGFMNLFQFDKLIHLLLFMILVWLMISGLGKQTNGSIPKQDLVFLCLLTGTLYGGLTEIFQHFFIPGRIASWTDFVANEAGCFSGWAAYKWQNRKMAKW